jgi:3-mercaptopyruvate sulfurtransferase SseA
MKRTVRLAIILVSVSLVAAVSMLTGATQSQATAQESSGAVRRISAAELRDAWKKGKAILIDVRNEESYSADHIRGARLIIASDIGSHIKELPKNKLIATYCS